MPGAALPPRRQTPYPAPSLLRRPPAPAAASPPRSRPPPPWQRATAPGADRGRTPRVGPAATTPGAWAITGRRRILRRDAVSEDSRQLAAPRRGHRRHARALLAPPADGEEGSG